MSVRYPNLLSPLQVGGVLLKNRMVATAGIPHMLQGTEEYPTDRIITHMANRAKNGAAAVYLNFAFRTEEGPGQPPLAPGEIATTFPPHDEQINMAKTSAHNYLCQTIDAIRYYESIAVTQPMGSYTRTDPGPGGPRGGSADKQPGGGKTLVGVSAGLQNVALNEKIIREKKADIICMCRSWICDSDYGRKIYEGRGEDVTPCIRCNKCHVPNDSDKWRSYCSVNPKIGYEFKLDQMIEKPSRKKKVAVVGGGPAGMQCAVTLRERGHEVDLYEKTAALGGQLKHADYPSFKWPLADFNHWLIRETLKSGTRVLLNTEATRELLEKEGYDDVVVAIGPRFKTPKLEIQPGTKTMLCIDVFGHERELPHSIVVIGGSETGTETGMYLAENGHEVTVLTRQGMLAEDAPHAHYVVMLMDAYLEQKGFSFDRRVQKYTSVDPTGVTYINEHGEAVRVPCDLVVLSGGTAAVPEQCAAFYGSGDHVHYIGDCYRAGDVHKAVSAGWATANQI